MRGRCAAKAGYRRAEPMPAVCCGSRCGGLSRCRLCAADRRAAARWEETMTLGLSLLCAALLVIILGLLLRLFSVRRATREITRAIPEKILEETNTLITVPGSDPYIRELAAALNRQLKELRAQRHRYEQGDAELKEAVTNIVHDLRTPLTAIKGYLELSMEEEKSEKLAGYLTIIAERIEAMQQLIDELFRYSVVTTAAPLTLERTDLKRVLTACILSFYGAMQERDMEPEVDLPEEDLYAELDVPSARRVINNIISNCIKYSDGDMRICMQTDGTIVFSNFAKDLDAVKVGRLFDRFYTVESPSQATGLGLSIAKVLTERMNGTIRADYAEGRLSISLSFPLIP